jgi:hemolysin activation/secretion protein
MWFFNERFQSWLRAFLGMALLCLSCADAARAAPPPLPDASKPSLPSKGDTLRRPPRPSPKLLTPPETPPAKSPDETAIYVKAVRVEGVVDRPEYDISKAAVEKLAETARSVISARRAKAQEPAAEGKPPQPAANMTLGGLQEIAAEVARYYRSRGFFLAQAFVPPQALANDTVTIVVMEGRLGQVLSENARRYTPAQLAQPFAALMGGPVIQAEIEEGLLVLSDYPGLKVFGVFHPGREVGTSDLVLSVLEEGTTEFLLHADNYGTEFTGEYRGRLDIRYNNLFKKQDVLTASLSSTFAPNNGFFGALSYERMAFGPKNRFGLGYSRNAYALGSYLEPFDISGTTQLAELHWHRTLSRGLSWNSGAQLELARKTAQLLVGQGEDRQDDLTTLSAGYRFDWRGEFGNSYHAGGFTLTQGFDDLLGSMDTTDDPDLTTSSRQGGSKVFAGGEFRKLAWDYRYWRAISGVHALGIDLRGQYSSDLLVSLEQLPLGGPNGVRAYGASEWLRDKAYIASLEWLMRAPGFSQWHAFGNRRWGEILQFVFFADAGKGWLNDPLASDIEEVSLYGIGAGVRLNVGDFSARFEFATPVGEEKAENDRDPQYFFELNVGF